MRRCLKLLIALSYLLVSCAAGSSGPAEGAPDNAADIVDLLYEKEKGIGLNIFRYNIGAGLPSKA
jgi:hypothetical protein